MDSLGPLVWDKGSKESREPVSHVLGIWTYRSDCMSVESLVFEDTSVYHNLE